MNTFTWLFRHKKITGSTGWLLAGLVMVLGLTGCVNVPTPPPPLRAWLTPDQKTGVPGIAGSYQDTGDGFDKQGKYLGQFSLTSVLQTELPRPATNTDVVVIIGPDRDRLQIQTWHNLQLQSVNVRTNCDVPRASRLHFTYFINGDYCELPLVMDTTGIALLVLPVLIENVDVISDLRPAKDGSLMVYQYDCDAGIAFFVPFHHNQSRWYRFKPAIPAPGNGTNAPAPSGLDRN